MKKKQKAASSPAKLGSDWRGSWLTLTLALALVTVPVALVVNHEVPEPYMDEVFHVNQVQHYCRGDFAYWDPKITTFPGLYYVSLPFLETLRPFAHALKSQHAAMNLCQTPLLRSVNIVLCLVCALLFRAILLHLDSRQNEVDVNMRALVLSLYPLHWFFTFLYYTELGSAVAVMAMYLAILKKAYWISALLRCVERISIYTALNNCILERFPAMIDRPEKRTTILVFGAMSVLVRQTNAIWIIFVVCAGVLDFVSGGIFRLDFEQEQDQKTTEGALATGSESDEGRTLKESARVKNRRHFTGNKAMSSLAPTNSDIRPKAADDSGIIWSLLHLIKGVWFKRLETLYNFGPLVLVFAAFVVFVLYNGGIVVGDKEAHTVSLHFAQLLYCGLVCAGFLAAVHFSPQTFVNFIHVVRTSSKARVLTYGIIALVASFIAVHFFSVVHPYLLADNRHFVFYIWKDILRRHWSFRYAVIPIYIISWWSILSTLGQQVKSLWILAYFLAIVGTLVPAPLLEFRYYNIPFYLLFLHSCQKMSNKALLLTALHFIAVNVFTFYAFLSWPFEWANEPGKLQRFMW